MTEVCNSWSLASKEQGNSLSFLCLYLECSLCSSHADTHTPYPPQVSAASGPLDNLCLCESQLFLLLNREDETETQPGDRRVDGEGRERPYFLMGLSGFKPLCWQDSTQLNCPCTWGGIYRSSGTIVPL